MKHAAGFTLLEVLVVVVIAISVTAFAVPAYKKTQERSKFLAAQGILLDIGSALQSLRTDFFSAGKNGNNAPAAPIRLTTTHQKTSDTTYKSIEDAVSLDGVTLSDENTAYALFARGYMQRIPYDSSSTYKGYRFYLCPASGTGASGCCRSTETTVACMRQNSSCSSSNYPGAYISAGGQIVSFEKGSSAATTACQ